TGTARACTFALAAALGACPITAALGADPITAALGACPVTALCTCPITAATGTIAGARPIAATGTSVAAGTKRLLAVVAAEIHAVVRAAADVIALAEFVGDVLVVVAHAVAMIDVVIPIIAAVVDVDGTINVDVVVVPIDSATPIVSAGRPTSNGITCAERQSGCEQRAAARPIACAPIVRRIGRIGPRAI